MLLLPLEISTSLDEVIHQLEMKQRPLGPALRPVDGPQPMMIDYGGFVRRLEERIFGKPMRISLAILAQEAMARPAGQQPSASAGDEFVTFAVEPALPSEYPEWNASPRQDRPTMRRDHGVETIPSLPHKPIAKPGKGVALHSVIDKQLIASERTIELFRQYSRAISFAQLADPSLKFSEA